MATDDYLRDDIERTQQYRTRRRRSGRSRRRRVYLLVGFLLIVGAVLAVPSFLSHSPMGRSIVANAVSEYGIDAEIDSFNIGWITPLKINGVQLKGREAGSEISIERIDTGMTVQDLIVGNPREFGEVVVRGIEIVCSVREGRCSLEDDLSALLEPTGESSAPVIGTIDIQEAAISVTDEVSSQTWSLTQTNATVDLLPSDTRATFAGVLSDPIGGGGALQGNVQLSGSSTDTQPLWSLKLESESLPLSVVTLVSRRFPQETAGMPRNLSGDATGGIEASGYANGNIDATLHSLQIRDLHATEPVSPGLQRQPRVWTNKLATINGNLSIIGDRVVGRGLAARADFASASLDGAFSKSMTLVGTKDNPLRWLEALDGTARAEIDLAMMDQAMPGLLPLRHGAQLVSGRATAQIDSMPSNGARKSKLIIQSDAIRARTRGRAVVLDPVEISATVADENGKVRAEQFQLTSAFASAVGKGGMQSGNADFQIDFGRLSAMLRPIVDMSNASLGGAAKGKVSWNASKQNIWTLNGNANASNLLVTLPSGQTVKQNTLTTKVIAIGRWGDQSLQELSQAQVSMGSNGMNVLAELTSPVVNPNAATPLPIQLEGSGRIESLNELLSPWLPTELHDAEGQFKVLANATLSGESGRIANTRIELANPRIAYGDRYFTQPALNLNFEGALDLPSGDLVAKSLTLAGDAVSLAMQGEATANNINIEVAWRAKLERLQGSVRKRTRWPNGNALARPAGYLIGGSPNALQTPMAGVATSDWLITGDCEGSLIAKTQKGVLEIQSDSSGKNIAIVQPPDASAQSYTVGPMPQRRGFGQYTPAPTTAQRVVWSEPNLRINGTTRYDLDSGRINADAMELTGDWFSTTLTGHAIWNETVGDIVLKGPASLKMDEVSSRLTTLSGTQIRVQGVQETPLEIHAARDAQGNVAFDVQGKLGWDVGEIAGVQFGGAVVPVRLTETTVEISPATIPVGQGQVNLAGEVFYRPGPIWMKVQPGTVARNLHLTPEMTNRWLKYLAPLAANTANIDGTMSVELDEAIVVIDAPEQSRVNGRINIDQAQMTAGPLAAQIISGVDQLKALTRSTPTEARDQTTLLTMPPQTVDFALAQGVVQHQRLFFEIDRAQIMTSGRVTLDSKVDLVAQLPLDERWLGKDLQDLAGQPVTLPISGTLSRPTLDPSGIRNVVTQLGTQAVSTAAKEKVENYLQSQLNKGIEKIFGR